MLEDHRHDELPPHAPPVGKAALRDEMKRRLSNQPAELAEILSRRICARVVELPEVLGASTLMVYAPLRHEADIAPVASEWTGLFRPCARVASPQPASSGQAERFSGSARLCVPALDFKTCEMWPAKISNWSKDLVLNHIGLREPIQGAPRVAPAELDVVLVPALAFDRRGHRLGRGGGFYDRFLSTLPAHVTTIGIAFRMQILDAVPTEPHDRPVGTIVTEDAVVRVAPIA